MGDYCGKKKLFNRRDAETQRKELHEVIFCVNLRLICVNLPAVRQVCEKKLSECLYKLRGLRVHAEYTKKSYNRSPIFLSVFIIDL